MLRKPLYFLLIGFFLCTTTRCGNDPEPEVQGIERYLVSDEETQAYSYQSLQTLLAAVGFNELSNLLQYDVQAHRIIYRTLYKDQVIEASGLVFVPQGATSPLPLLSLQHGTTFVKDDVPSVSGEFSGVEFFGAAGYVAVMPDFIGYGRSEQVFHPYYDYRYSAYAVIDLLKATKEFLSREGIAHDDKLFLSGYSEGGYVSMAAAKEIEENPGHGLRVTALSAGAGGYDLNHMLSYIAGTETYAYPAYLAFLIMAYNETNDWNRPLTDFFREPYAGVLATYLNGAYDGGFINSRLTTSVADLLAPDFYASLNDDDQQTEFKDALAANSVGSWEAGFPVRLFHGTADVVIPYENSSVTEAQMRAQGTADITLTGIPGGEHGNTLIPMLIETIPWFEDLR